MFEGRRKPSFTPPKQPQFKKISEVLCFRFLATYPEKYGNLFIQQDVVFGIANYCKKKKDSKIVLSRGLAFIPIACRLLGNVKKNTIKIAPAHGSAILK